MTGLVGFITLADVIIGEAAGKGEGELFLMWAWGKGCVVMVVTMAGNGGG